MSARVKNPKNKEFGKLSSSELLRDLQRLSSRALGKAGSDNYRQKLVFDLLNAVKANDQNRFFWILLRALNAQVKDNSDAKRLANLLGEAFLSSEANFEKVAYSVILGIMSGGER
ncbi:hypothetical protein A3L11_06180 [Thermococcus siculi]|uniref:Uncharacterized protein n=1 Tax=Thermococcus siculi TaxID=72803 RepID=A0A2Z2MN14_9EURY|nr:hypothetical protein [Thermococcus siculi]ASJ08831.1 hypothetical protein A3L11_06180 [Thermococcus siculi]